MAEQVNITAKPSPVQDPVQCLVEAGLDVGGQIYTEVLPKNPRQPEAAR